VVGSNKERVAVPWSVFGVAALDFAVELNKAKKKGIWTRAHLLWTGTRSKLLLVSNKNHIFGTLVLKGIFKRLSLYNNI